MNINYHKKSEGVSYTLHKELILFEIFLVNIENLGVINITYQEQCNEKSNHDINSCKSQYSCSEAENQSCYLSAPEYKVQQLNNSPGGAANGKQKQQQVPAADGPAVRSRNSANGIKKTNSSNSQANGSGTFNENDTFNKHYNKELRVSKDEIPIVLAELNDSAIQFIKREQYEKSLNLLQKAYGIMDVVDFNLCRRDKFHLFILFHNMALCYQKMQMLDECAQCIEQSLEYLPLDQFNLSEKSISNRMKKLQILGKLKMQYCAILSQVHRHKDALEQAREGVKISHLLINDMKQLAEFYVKREEIEQSFQLNHNKSNGNISRNGAKNENDFIYSSYYSNNHNSNKKANSSRNRSFSQFLSQQEANQSEDFRSNKPPAAFHKRQESFQNNLSSFYSVNYLEESMSYLERTAKKLIPILVNLKKKMIPEKNMKNANSAQTNQTKTKLQSIDTYNEDANSDNEMEINLQENQQNLQIDMKNILGYLNQGEWTSALSIGSIMQLQPFTLKDLLEQGKNELELTRDSFIGKVSFLAVSYFCYSTEIRFILQMKEDPTYDPLIKQKESEYWHAKSLEIACTFLPGECPLLNHINLSYQKHFAPVKTTIMEDEPNNDDLIVVKPLNGIDNPKFQPIIRQVQNIEIAITPYQMTPINQIAHEFLSQMISFNDYQEQQSQQQNSVGITGSVMPPKFHQKSKSGDITKKAKTVIQKKNQQSSYDELIDEDLVGSNKNHVSVGQFDDQDELRKFEELFDKLIKENKIDKLDLLRKLKMTQDGSNNQMLEEGESSQFNDLLLDEQILGEESLDEEQIASEAIHHNSNQNNLYKFRNKENIRNERPKTSHSIHRGANNNTNSIGDPDFIDSEKDKSSHYEQRQSHSKQQLQQVEENKKKSQRPLSGGLQKIKHDSQRSRINKMNQNFSMYEKYGGSNGGNGLSPEKMAQYQSMKSQNSNQNVYQHMQPPKSAQQNKSFDNNSKLNYLNNNQITSTLNPKSNQVQLLVNEKKGALQQQTNNNVQAYDELKRRLLNEYKKLTTNKKTFDDQVRERYKNLKQRAVSGKKSAGGSNLQPQQQVVQTVSANQIPATGQQSFIASSGTGNLSPKHHLNVYKPTFIINNSFANESGNQAIGIATSKELDVVDQISKKYRPQSKGASIQNSTSQQVIMSSSASASRQSQVAQFHDRQGNQYQNQPINGNQQLMNMLINPEKKSTNLNNASKKNMKSHNLSQGQQELNFVKQFLNEKGQPTQTKQQLSQIQNQNLSPFPQGTNQNNSFTSQNQFQYQTQQQFSNKPLIAQIEAQMNKKQGNTAATSSNIHQNQKKQVNQNQISTSQQQIITNTPAGGAPNSQQKLAAYEKLKKKLNYHASNQPK